jgi:hypothetical protein
VLLCAVGMPVLMCALARHIDMVRAVAAEVDQK